MSPRRWRSPGQAAVAVAVAVALAVCSAPIGAQPTEPVSDADLMRMLRHDFRGRGAAGLDRLEQDPVQQLCTDTRDRPAAAEAARMLEEQRALVRWPPDGSLLGDWRAGEKIAQDGRGMTWADRPGVPGGGNCYGCHRISPQEIAYGTIGPSLLRFGRERGRSPEVQRYVYGHIYNAKAYNLCS
ncbi:MAG TPA: sulfur oxidation c-type cytochrome SoxX, partial [Burkholderiaceae bacterium]